MTTDSKLGLVAGIAAVLAVAVVYHDKPSLDAAPAQAAIGSATTPPALPPAAVGVPTLPAGQARGVPINAETRPADPRRL